MGAGQGLASLAQAADGGEQVWVLLSGSISTCTGLLYQGLLMVSLAGSGHA